MTTFLLKSKSKIPQKHNTSQLMKSLSARLTAGQQCHPQLRPLRLHLQPARTPIAPQSAPMLRNAAKEAARSSATSTATTISTAATLATDLFPSRVVVDEADSIEVLYI